MEAVTHRQVAIGIVTTRHSPRLSTQLMVEGCIRENGSFPSKRALLEALPRKMEYRTLVTILQYLEASEKIILTEDGSISWIFADNPKLIKLLERSPVLSKPIRTSPRT